MNGQRVADRRHAGGRRQDVSVADNGRGFRSTSAPQDRQEPRNGGHLPDAARGGSLDNDAYKVAGGLHGVGASVVNALSKSLVAAVRRDGLTYSQKYRRGKPVAPVEPGEPARGSGTMVTFTPDPEIFLEAEPYDEKLIAERLDVKTYLNKGLVIQFVDKKHDTTVEFRHDGGVADFLDAMNQTRADSPRRRRSPLRPRTRRP